MRNDDVSTIDPELHERLCAYVFGELDERERALFEAELARSPALRGEQERLVATVGLVKRALPDEGLSQAVRRDLLASARRSRFRRLAGRRLVSFAAAAVVLVGGAVAWWRVGGSDERAPFTYSPFDAKTAGPSTPGAAAPRGNDGAIVAKLERAEGPGQADRSTVAREGEALDAEQLRMLQALGYSGGGDSAETIDRDSRPAENRVGLVAQPPSPESAPSAGAPIVLRDELSAHADVKVDDFSKGHHGTGMPSPFVSRRAGAATRKKAFESPYLAWKESEGGGAYRGAGDSMPPGGAATPGARDGAEFLGVALQPAPGDEPELLDELGYGGDDSSQEKADGFFDAPPASQRVRAQREEVRRQEVETRSRELIARTELQPGESPRDMFYRFFGDAPFVLAAEEHTSTFAVDVDTASYALARAYLEQGQLPPREAVRTEEFVNYFKPDQSPPSDGKPFAIGLELAPSLFGPDARAELLRVTVRAKDVPESERQPVALTFVIDNSGSMSGEHRLGLVQRTLALLLGRLDGADSVAVVKFSNSAAVVTPRLPLARRAELQAAIEGLGIEGGTNVEGGLRLGYELAQRDLQPSAINRVILCSDGVGNIGETSAKGLLALVEEARKKGIYLNTVGVGMGNHDDAFLEELADKGDGVCNYVDGDAEARRVFVDGLAGALVPVARDVKIQVEFDPAQVESWRLLGYENRALRTQDFRNDKIDAGEVNAGHQVSALYELVRLPGRAGPLASVRLRYKPPFAIDQGREGQRARAAAEEASEIERTLSSNAVLPGFAAGTNGYQRAVLVAQFAEVLRQSVHARGDSFARLLQEARRLEALGDPDFAGFVALLARANPLLDQRAQQETPRVQELLDRLGRLHYEEALRQRKHELAREAGEPQESPEGQGEDERAGLAASEEIQRLEAEVRKELDTVQGLTIDELKDLGYGDDR